MSMNLFATKRSIDRYFGVSKLKSTFTKEILSGILVFFSMLYILPVNASIMNLNDQIPFGAVFGSTALVTFISCFLAGLFGKTPLSISTCMGLNAYLAYTVANMGYNAQEIMAIVLILGILFFIVSVTPIRMMIVNALPKTIKQTITAGLGLFIAFVGLKMGGVIVADSSTGVAFGSLKEGYVLLSLFGIFLVFMLSVCKIKFLKQFSIIIALVTTALLGGFLDLGGVVNMPSFVPKGETDSVFQMFDYCFIGIKGIPSVLGKLPTYGIIISMLIVHLFGTTAPIFGVGEKLKIIDSVTNKMVNHQKVFMSDGCATIFSGLFSTSPAGYFVESSVGIEFGGRTGISNIVTSLLFLLTLFIFPIFNIFSPVKIGNDYYTPVTSLSLVMIGGLMFAQLKDIDWKDMICVFTSAITVLMIILTYSLTDGIGVGIILYVLMMLCAGKAKKVGVLVYILALVFLFNFIVSKVIL